MIDQSHVFHTAKAKPVKKSTDDVTPEAVVTNESAQMEDTSGEIRFKTSLKDSGWMYPRLSRTTTLTRRITPNFKKCLISIPMTAPITNEIRIEPSQGGIVIN